MTTQLTRTLMRLALLPVLLVVLPFLTLVSWYCLLHWSGNYHPVVDAELYRSGQLEAQSLLTHIREDHLKSVLNLRGPNPAEQWYRDELAVTLQNGVEHQDITLSAGTPVPPEQARRILDWIEQAPKPLLVHCSDGADRTGLVMALYLASHGQSAQTARSQLSVRFGHFPYAHWAFSQNMDDSLDLYLESQGSTPPSKP